MTTYLSGSKKMYEAYNEGKDLYAIIAQSAFNNNYEDNLEFYPEGTELEIDGQKVIAGKKTHLNKDGKARRSTGKVLNLACTYGMSGATAGQRLGYAGAEAKQKGEELLNNFFGGFPEVKTAIDQSKDFLKKNGYVEDFIGRRRRLSDINLDPYRAQVKNKIDNDINFNPFIDCQDRRDASDPEFIWTQILEQYIVLSNAYHAGAALVERRKPVESRQQEKCTYEAKAEMSSQTFDKLIKYAANPSIIGTQPWNSNKKSKKITTYADKLAEDAAVLRNILINGEYSYYDYESKQSILINLRREMPEINTIIERYTSKYGNTTQYKVPQEQVILSAWTGKIAQASRQCFNARIQGSAASLTKMAMVDIFNDPQLNAWDAHLIITVHDEVLVECPEQYADLVEKRLPEIMVNAAYKAGDDVPQSCDPYNVTRWYSDTAAASIMDEFKKAEKAGLSRDDALAKVIANHIEVPEEAIIETIETGCDLDF